MKAKSTNISKAKLVDLYVESGLSMAQIAQQLGNSVNSVVYWMNKYEIPRRSISDAIYKKHNPEGDPFTIQSIDTQEDSFLLGLGLGLYWGEGNKANKYSLRLGNTDTELVKIYILFLTKLFGVKKDALKFGLQIFTDTKPEKSLKYWKDALGVKQSQFYKITVTISGSIGTYRKKSQYGVLTVYFHNKKLRDIIVNMLPT